MVIIMKKNFVKIMVTMMVMVTMISVVNPMTAYAARRTTGSDENGDYTVDSDGNKTYNGTNDNYTMIHTSNASSNASDSARHNGSYNGRDYSSYSYDNGNNSSNGGSNTDISNRPVFNLDSKYFDDDFFYQLNTKIYVPEIYKLSDFNRLVSNVSIFDYDESVDMSHLAKEYVAPVLEDGTSYMSIYGYTYVYSNDELTEAFMSKLSDDPMFRGLLMNADEYDELVSIYNTYADSCKYDVNTYVYHYIVDYIDIMYGDKLFNYDFYCEKYPMLASLYEFDEEALKQHFYSVGMFEGRQGIATFNVDNYTSATDDLAMYYIEYALSSDDETYEKTSKDAYQIRLYDLGFDAYVADVTPDHNSDTFVTDLATPYIQGELNALASERVRFQLGDFESYGHDRMSDFFFNNENGITVAGIDNALNGASENIAVAGENNYLSAMNDYSSQRFMDSMYSWRMCDSHYTAATSSQYIYVGQSYVYTDYNNTGTGYSQKAKRTFNTICTIMFSANDVKAINAYYDAQ